MRAAVVGARRRSQGTGEFVARELARQGVEVPAVVGTSPETLAKAQAELEARHGLRCRGYLDLASLLAAEDVHVVAICSPPAAHLPQVELALERGCHVLCEKPLTWTPGLEREDPAALGRRLEELVELAARVGRCLQLNTQWPCTLEAFRQLHPGVAEAPLRELTLWLSPVSCGSQAVVDSGSHLLSMLHALAGPGELDGVTVTYHDEERARSTLSARYAHARGVAQVELRLARCAEPPRPAGYAVNGKSVDRRVEMPSYRISFEADGRAVPVRDPLAVSVEDFVRNVRAGRLPDREAIVAGMLQLQQLVAAASQP